MNGLVLHCGAAAVSREDLSASHTPAPTVSHVPIPHVELLDRLGNVIDSNGWKIVEEGHALTRSGNRYFGLLRVENGAPDVDYGTVIGLRNSHDMSFRAEMAIGAKCFVCDNLSFSGDVVIGRKHTKEIMRDLDRLIAQAFGQVSEARAHQHKRFEFYKDQELSDHQAHDLIIRAIDCKAVIASKVPALLSQWRTPSHDEFKPRTAWSLFNAFTEIYKTQSLANTHVRSQRLHGLLDTRLGLGA